MTPVLTVEATRLRLADLIGQSGEIAVALSGGIDSLVLSAAVHEVCRGGLSTYTLFHAVSAAVSTEATERVHALAQEFNWNLRIIEANEFRDQSYLSNPANRCFYCKTSLYGTIRSLTKAVIFSGTNLDDLSDYRPGLQAASDFEVRHPFVEAGIDKQMIRQLSGLYGLKVFENLPASPCLASRVETGILIDAAELIAVDKIEHLVAARFACRNVRCRLRSTNVVIELDEELVGQFLQELNGNPSFVREIRSFLGGRLESYPITCAAYLRGSAFLQAN